MDFIQARCSGSCLRLDRLLSAKEPEFALAGARGMWEVRAGGTTAGKGVWGVGKAMVRCKAL